MKINIIPKITFSHLLITAEMKINIRKQALRRETKLMNRQGKNKQFQVYFIPYILFNQRVNAGTFVLKCS